MFEWWSNLTVVNQILWGVTLSASLIFVIETVMTFIGADVDSDFDFDTDASGGDMIDGGANLYTFRNFVNFFLGFGWSAILLQDSISSTGVLLAVSVLIGIALVAIVMYIFKWLSSMQQSGNINVYQAAPGAQGKVYLTVPGQRSGVGKIQITINNSVREYDAVTDEEDNLPTGSAIRVVEVLSPTTMLVEKFNTLII